MSLFKTTICIMSLLVCSHYFYFAPAFVYYVHYGLQPIAIYVVLLIKDCRMK